MKGCLSILVIALGLWISSAKFVWKWRHPHGNDTTFTRNLWTALKFGTNPDYQ